MQVGKTDLLSDVRHREPITAICWQLARDLYAFYLCLQVGKTDLLSDVRHREPITTIC
jgi:hypothetical protein